MKRIALLLCLGAALAVLYPAAAGAARFSGVVVAKQTHRHALVIASRSGTVRTVRTTKRIRVGSRVVVNARVAADPALLEEHVRRELTAACQGVGATAQFRAVQSFRPGRPQPTHRYAVAK